jgi:hypothetical protein
MKSSNDLRRLAGVTGAALAGALFFFVIIGVFGQEAAIAGLLLFVITAIVIYRAFSVDGETL